MINYTGDVAYSWSTKSITGHKFFLQTQVFDIMIKRIYKNNNNSIAILCSTLIYLKDIRPLIPKYTHLTASPHHFLILPPDGDKRRLTLANSAIFE